MPRAVSFDGMLDPGVAMTPVKQVAAMHSRGKDIQILFGSECKTDGRTVWLPDISDKADPYHIKMLLHGMYHEVSHVHNTDFKIHGSWIKKHQSSGLDAGQLKLLHTCQNVLEDVRIEAKVCSEYPGVKFRMHEFLKLFVERDLNARFANPQVPMIKKLLDLAYLDGRDQQLKADGFEDLQIMVPRDVGEIYSQHVQDIVNRVVVVKDFQEILGLAEELFSRVRHLAEEPPPSDGGESEPPKPLAEGDVVRLKGESGKYGIVTKILGNKQFEVREVSKQEAKAHLKGG